MKHLKSGLAVVSLISMAMTGASAGQSGDPTMPGDEGGTAPSGAMETALTPIYAFEFAGNIDGGGDFETHRIGGNLDLKFGLNRQTDLTIRANYEFANYHFGGDTALGLNPWGDIHEFNVGAIFNYRPTNDWSIFGGPVFQINVEGTGDWDEAWIAGGVIGATWETGNAVLGAGLGAVTQIEDTTRFYPIFIIEWEIASGMRLSTRPVTSASGDYSIELIFELEKNWDLAFGVGYRWSRFRLDNNGVAPHGVGEEKSVPTWIRLGWQLNEQTSISVFGGVLLGGTFRLHDTGGVALEKADYKATPFIGIGGTIRF